MIAILAWWGGSAVVIIGLSVGVGRAITRRWLGVLIDSRGRYSLTHLQLALWTITILSLLAGVFFGRWQHGAEPLGFSIPAAVLALLGISVGSAVTVGAAKVNKNTTRAANVAASAPTGPWQPSLSQIFLLEEGTYADQVVDITKFQNFVITIVLVLGYIGLAAHSITAAGTAVKVTALPGFSGTFLILLGISHAGYLAGKLPSPAGQPTGLSMATRGVARWAAAQPAAAAALPRPRRRPGRQGQRQRGPGWLWRYGANVNVWSDSAPLAAAPAGGVLVVTDPHPFTLHWTTDNWQPAYDTTATQATGGQYAVVLGPAELGGKATVQFTRRYLDRPAVGSNDGWEGTEATNHVVQLTTGNAPQVHGTGDGDSSERSQPG